MKAKHAVILIALGFCCDFAGALLKIGHWYGGMQVLFAGTVLKIAGVLVLAFKLITSRQLRDFMNH